MARNKYPEVTEAKILEVSLKLFLENGYEQTTIQDIVSELGGLTKGAVYHHFKSKEDIIDALGTQLFYSNNPFAKVKDDKSLNGLQKMKKAIRLSYEDTTQSMISIASISLLRNPRFLVDLVESNRTIAAPLFQDLIEEGIKDGSIQAQYAKPLSEVLVLLVNFWLIPSIYPAFKDELLEKLKFIKLLFDSVGLSIFDNEIMELCTQRCMDISNE